MDTSFIDTIQRTSTISFPGLFGDWSINPPAYFTLFGRNIYFYGVIIALGFILGISYCARNSGRFGIRKDDVYDLVIWIIPLSIIGARLYYVAFKLDYYLSRPAEIIEIWNGGLAIYGGVIVGVLTMFLFCRRKKIPAAAMFDLLIYGLLIGQIIGRWGNFMNREAFGAETDIFCRMLLTAPNGSSIAVHPTFLYESLWNLVGLAALIAWERRGGRRYDGQAALGYFLWYGTGRAWIEGLRTDSLYIGSTGIRVSQLLSALLALTALALLIYNSRRSHAPLYASRAADDAPETASEAEDSPEAEGAPEADGAPETDEAPEAEDAGEAESAETEEAEEETDENDDNEGEEK